jgi:S-adenosylmethionine synthetase
MEVILQRLTGKPIEETPVEIVERKGKGHPDSLCDGASEQLSIELSKYYVKHFGRIMHHNVDKCVLVGGASRADFGGGEVTTPIRFIMVGRAVSNVSGKHVPVQDIVDSTAKGWFDKNLRYLNPDEHLRVEAMIRPGSADLRSVFERRAVPMANDTSFGVGYAPLSELETLVLKAEQMLNSPSMKKQHPELGEDIKVMGVRVKDRMVLTVACAYVCAEVADREEYLASKANALEHLKNLAAKTTKRKVDIVINNADIPEHNSFYLTVTGTSAEAGDDGQVGRGNRVNGLITPYRAMTLEAAAGKNPVTHTGKLYNLVAGELARNLVADSDIKEAVCYMVSRIGAPITEPLAVNVKVRTDLSEKALNQRCSKAVREALNDLPTMWKKILKGTAQVF